MRKFHSIGGAIATVSRKIGMNYLWITMFGKKKKPHNNKQTNTMIAISNNVNELIH